MLKGMIGDYIGSIHEGFQWISKDEDLISLTVERLPVIKNAFNNRQVQTITDDTICTLGLYKAYIAKAEGTDAAQILADFCKNHMDNGFGKNFEKWIYNPVPYGSFANGCLMRLGFLYFVPKKERLHYAIDYTLISHNHTDSIEAVIDYVEILNNRDNIDILNKIAEKRNVVKTVEDYHNDKSFQISAKVTLNQVIAVLKESTSFSDILKNCMYIGGDTDTLATIACNLTNFSPSFYLQDLIKIELEKINDIDIKLYLDKIFEI
jgi:ADP-ribosylglycohydrolase